MKSRSIYPIITALLLFISAPHSVLCQESWQTCVLSNYDLFTIWGATDEDIYAAGAENTLLHYDGTSWDLSPQIQNNSPIIDIMSLWGVPLTAVVAVGGNGSVFLNDGLRWLKFPSLTANTINAVWGSSATNIHAVGQYGIVMRSNGTSWSLTTPSITSGIDLSCIWGSSADDVYAGGYMGKLIHFNGSAWEAVISGTSQDIRAMWGSSASDVYATGSYGEILRYDGSTWRIAAKSNGISLNALWGSGDADVFAAGDNGTAYHYNGSVWTKLSTPFIYDIRAAWGSTSGTVYFACEGGRLLVYSRDDLISPVVSHAALSKDNEGKVYISTPITLYFSEKMDQATLNSTTITMRSGGTVVPATLTIAKNVMSLEINGNFAYDTTYTATVASGTNGVKDIAGNALKTDHSLSFTMESKPAPEPGTGNGKSGCFISSARL